MHANARRPYPVAKSTSRVAPTINATPQIASAALQAIKVCSKTGTDRSGLELRVSYRSIVRMQAALAIIVPIPDTVDRLRPREYGKQSRQERTGDISG